MCDHKFGYDDLFALSIATSPACAKWKMWDEDGKLLPETIVEYCCLMYESNAGCIKSDCWELDEKRVAWEKKEKVRRRLRHEKLAELGVEGYEKYKK